MQGEAGMAWWVWFLIVGGALAAALYLWRVRKGGESAVLPMKEPSGMPLARDYNPKNVGNDSAARPWEQGSIPFDASMGQEPMLDASQDLPSTHTAAGFDVAAFLQASKDNFIKLQAAWDRADVPALRAMMTDDMIAQIQQQLVERENQAGAAENLTEVVMLEAKLLGMEDLPTEYMASVEFSGMIREEPAAGPNPFREVWNITRPKAGQAGWLVADVQALQ